MKQTAKRIALGAGIVAGAFALFVLGSLFVISRTQPTTAEVDLGVSGGSFTPCPETPNCVSTMADPSNETAYVEPIPLSSAGGEAALEELTRWVEEHPRGAVETRREQYLHATFASPGFGFIDDLEVYLPEGGDVLHIRSAARVGRSDLGVNRERYEEIRGRIGQ
ncbi:MAG: DUF1499 domain-containing protein [Alkalispirochaetaceae bacterium]